MILRGVELIGEDASHREVAIRGGTVAWVGAPSAHRSPNEPFLDFVDAIAFPALINSHDHLEFNLYPALGHKHYADYVEWGEDVQPRDAALIASIEGVPRPLRLRWGGLKNLLCGATTVAHHGHARDDLGHVSIATLPGTAIHSVRAAPHWRWRLNAPVARPPYVFHVGEGTSQAASREIDELLRWNIHRRPLIGVHAIAMRPEQAAHFRAVVWCPVSNEFLYGVTANVASLKRNTAILFGSDSTLSADWNVWNHLRRARALGALTDRELFDSVTQTAARVWRLSPRRIAAGAIADIVVARKKEPNPWDAFFAIDPEDILLILRDGKVVLSDTALDTRSLAGRFSVVRLGNAEKLVAEDVPELLASIRAYGVAPNLPLLEAAHWRAG